MANPQKENGYTAIANELLERLSLPGLNGSEYRILTVIFRKTFGFQKKTDKIALSQFKKMTGMKQANVVQTIKSLVVKSILIKENNIYKINKNWEQWVVVKRLHSSQKHTLASSQKHTKSGSQKHTYKRKKETITKENTATNVASPYFPKKKDPLEKVSCEKFIESCKQSPNKHIQIIGEWAEAEKPNHSTRGEWESFMNRNLRAAKNLIAFDLGKIEKAYNLMLKDVVKMEKGRKVGFITKYSLETVGKYIDKV